MPHANVIPIRFAATEYSSKSKPGVQDRLGRPMLDLRISVTDRCNLRCSYCMPGEIFDKNHAYLPRSELLSLEEIARIASTFAALGVRKIRLTGGEPLLRRGIVQLVEKLAMLKTPDGAPVEIAMTTNGVLLAERAQALKDAGLSRITVSLDALDQAIFSTMSGSDVNVAGVLAGIVAAQRAGLSPKVNMVVKRGVNDGEIIGMAEHFRSSGIVLRFIEYMDAGSSNGWLMDDVYSAAEIVALISARHPLLPVDPNFAGEVASRYAYADGSGEIGLISSVTKVFCHDCTRIRLSTDGRLYTCLFAEQMGADLKRIVRNGGSDLQLGGAIAECWKNRSDRYSQIRNELQGLPRNKIEMSYIGG